MLTKPGRQENNGNLKIKFRLKLGLLAVSVALFFVQGLVTMTFTNIIIITIMDLTFLYTNSPGRVIWKSSFQNIHPFVSEALQT